MYKQIKYRQFPFARQAKRIFSLLAVGCSLVRLDVQAIENNGRGTKSIGMANTFVSVSDDPWAIYYNPAGLVQIQNTVCSVFFVPGQFGLKELQTKAASIAIPLSFTTIGLKAESFGFDLYKETELGIGFALNAGQFASIGLCFSLNRIDIIRYGHEQNMLIDMGILAYVSKNTKVGFCLNNINRAGIGIRNEPIPLKYSIGACWLPVEELQLSVEMEKDNRYPTSLKIGMERILLHILALRLGVANEPDKYSAGFAVRYLYFEFGYAGYSHHDLGWTHQIELSYTLEKE